jgi:hypothetical protein
MEVDNMHPVEYVKERGWHIVNIITEDLHDNRDTYRNLELNLFDSLPISKNGITLVEDNNDTVIFEGEYIEMADMGEPSKPLTKEDTYVKITFEKVE